MKKISIFVLSLILVFSFNFINVYAEDPDPSDPGAGTTEPTEPTQPELTITLSEESIELEEGATKELTATISDQTKAATWSSSDSEVATVENGKVTAKKAGTATIKATVEDKEATCRVTVKAKEVETVDYKIVIKGGKLNKEFNKNITDYEVEVTDINNFEISVTPSNVKKRIPGYSDLKSVGSITVTIEGKEYHLKINVPSANTYLSSLKVTGYAFNQTFDKDTLSYTLRVGYDVNEIKIEAKAEDDKATVSGTGSFELEVGSQTFTIKVTNESDTKTYRIFVTRDEEEVKETKKTKTISRTSKSSDNDFDIPDVEDPDSPISIAIITIGSLVLFSIGAFGIYFYIKTSPRRLKKEILRKQKNQEESPIVEINNTKEVEEPTKEFK